MRHRKSGRKLGRTHSHRKATLSALSVSLIQHKKIRTTLAKAKEARMVVEKLVTRAKRAVAGEGEGTAKNVHARRVVFAFLRDREAVSTLFNDIAPKVASRAGGYTRVVKLGQRRGDGAELALIEFVDYNLGQAKSAGKPAAKASKATRKGRAEKASEKKTTAKAGKKASPKAKTSDEEASKGTAE